MIAEEIRAVMAAKSSALVRRSADDMAALMHPDFVHVTAGGRTLTKADYLDVFLNADRVLYRSQVVRELEVRLFDTVAVAHPLELFPAQITVFACQHLPRRVMPGHDE